MEREVNECRTARVAEVLADFRTLQYYIAAGPVEPENEEDYYTEGWATLRQCTIDGQYILDVAADTRVPAAQGGEEEQTRAELQQCVFFHSADEASNQLTWYSKGFARCLRSAARGAKDSPEAGGGAAMD